MYKHNSVGNASKLRIKNVNECVTASTKLYLLGGFGNVLLIPNESNVIDLLSCRLHNFCNLLFSCTLLMFSGNINDEYIRRGAKIGNVRC